MTLKKCNKCQKIQTTKNSQFKGRDPEGLGLFFNCLNTLPNGESCGSTIFLRSKNWLKILSQKNGE